MREMVLEATLVSFPVNLDGLLETVPTMYSNTNLRFMWQQLSMYHTDLLQPFEDFLKLVIEEIQKAYARCQELETTLMSKTEQHDKEITNMYDEMDQLLQKERETLQEKHFEKEEHQKNEFNRALEARERDLQDALRIRSELECKLEALVDDINEARTLRDKTEKQLNQTLSSEYRLRQENEYLQQEYEQVLSRLNMSMTSFKELQDHVLQVTKIAEVDKENYRRCLRHYKDIVEEKEFLDMNINNMSQELEEMRTLNKSLLERVDSTTFSTSILWEGGEQSLSEPSSPTLTEDFSFEESNGPVIASTPVRKGALKMANLRQGYKVIFVGDAAVGKSSLIKRICRGNFDNKRTVTTDPDCYSKTVRVGPNEITLKLWDTVGQERFNSLPPSYFRKSDVVVLMYDIVEEISFVNAKSWMKTIHEYTDENVTLVLVGNKTDLEHRREVKRDKGVRLANENDAIFLETSAKTSENVNTLCDMIASSIQDKEDTLLIRETCVLMTDNMNQKRLTKRGCCHAM